MLYESGWVNLSLEDVEIPGHGRLEHHVIRVPRQTVASIVTDDAEHVLLIWRHRFITNRWGWEIPAGWVDQGETPLMAARREVEEETGWRPASMTELCAYHPLDGISDLRQVLYRATGASYVGMPSDAAETARVEWIPMANLPRLIRDGELTDGPSLTGLAIVAGFPDLTD